jgi:uncharacterized glyoxalase superfamily protein PhnB
MPENNNNVSQRIVPMIAYEDGAAAIDWLVRAFGFREITRTSGDDGQISHAELELGGGVICWLRRRPTTRDRDGTASSASRRGVGQRSHGSLTGSWYT